MDKIFTKSENVASRIVDGEAVLVTSHDGCVKILNETGSRVWDLIDGERTVDQIVEVVEAEFEVNYDELKKDVTVFFEELRSKELVTEK